MFSFLFSLILVGLYVVFIVPWKIIHFLFTTVPILTIAGIAFFILAMAIGTHADTERKEKEAVLSEDLREQLKRLQSDIYDQHLDCCLYYTESDFDCDDLIEHAIKTSNAPLMVLRDLSALKEQLFKVRYVEVPDWIINSIDCCMNTARNMLHELYPGSVAEADAEEKYPRNK